jgi:dihydrofolate synthase/folylpolyglutamate synthase
VSWPSGSGSDLAERLDYAAALRYLYEELTPERPGGFRSHGTDRARALLRGLGNPQESVATVHVAGTAGKGSVCAFVAAILTAHGFRVGAHLSPHAYELVERFQIDGGPVPGHVLVDELDRVRPQIERVEEAGLGRPTFFEVTNAIAFGIFDGTADYNVIETGIGGLLDSTNVIARRDKLAVLTPIGLDHTDVLGATLPEIAAHKAGMLPTGGQAISARNGADVDAVIAAAASYRQTQVDFVDLDAAVRDARVGRDGTVLRLAGEEEMALGLQGRHQAGNAALALRAVRLLGRRDGWAVDPSAVRAGLRLAALPGRFERRVVGGRSVILDGAHNAFKIASVVATLNELYPGQQITWVLALKHDKDLGAVLRAVAPTAAFVVATEFHTDGGDHPSSWSHRADDIAAAARRTGLQAVSAPDPLNALDRALTGSQPSAPVVVSGSFHLLAAIDVATRPR